MEGVAVSSSLSHRELPPMNGHPLSLEKGEKLMAKAGLTPINKLDEAKFRAYFGAILGRAIELAGLIDKEAADQLGVDPAVLSRWLSGKENAQMWRFQAHETLGPALLAAQAEATPGATIRTVIELERKVG
jgi:hypothetical protein